MAKKKQRKKRGRRGVSLKGLTYQRLKGYCDDQGSSVSGFLENLITEKLNAAGAPVPKEVAPPRRRRKKPDEEIISQHFTF